MWLVRVALQRPYTFVVMAMLIVILGVFTILRMPTDIFPDIDIPVISVIWNYGGLPAEEMEKRIVTNYERVLTTTVNDIEHIESQSLTGVAVIKIFFQPGANIEAATAQVTAISQPIVRADAARRDAAVHHPLQRVERADPAGRARERLAQRAAALRLRHRTSSAPTSRRCQGAQIPWPYGGKQRQIMVDIDPQRLYAWGLSPRDVNNALGAQNVILPTGTAKMGVSEYPIVINSQPRAGRARSATSADQDRERHDGLRARRRQRARRLRAADEHGARRRAGARC